MIFKEEQQHNKEVDMWDEIITLALNHGLISAMFVGLMIYVLKDCAKRENKSVVIIEQLAQRFGVVEEISTSVKNIQKELQEVKQEINRKK